MRRFVFSIAAGLALFGASTAHAGTLVSATWTQVVAPLADGPAFVVSETITGLSATGTSTATSISVALTLPASTESLFVPDGRNFVDLYFLLTQGGPQVIQATADMASADAAIPGKVSVWFEPLLPGGNRLIYVPLAHGQAGHRAGYGTVIRSYFYYAVDFYAWTPNTLVFTMLHTDGAPLPDVVAMGSFNLTAAGAGTVTLVTPTKFTTYCAVFSQTHVTSLSTLKLTFVPEPGTGLLLGAGAVALLLVRARGHA